MSKKNIDFNIPITIAGVKFRNPFYVSSGPTTMTVEQLEKMEQYGWGGASLKLTIDPEPYINRVPRYGYYPEKNFLSFTAEKRLLLKDLLKLIEQGRKRAPDVVLFSNITYAGPKGVEGWVNMAKQCENAGVHINELNMCCPNMSFNVELTGKSESAHKTGASLGQNVEAIKEIVKAIKSETKIPLFVKITPEGGDQARIANAALEAGADAVGGNANRLGIPPINLDAPTSSEYYLQKEIGMACMNGEWLKPLALRDVYSMRRIVGPDANLTGTGGIAKWQDAVEMIMCGADLIGICAETLISGFGFMPEFIDGFRKYMNSKDYKTTSDMRDILVPAITSAPDLTLFQGNARKITDKLSAPCTFACPNSIPAQGYVRKVAEEDFEEAYQLIMSRSPLQSICGKVCDHPCEDACTRSLIDEPIMIRAIKHCVLNMAEKEGWTPRLLDTKTPDKNAKVAIVGSGPAGLACAYDLARTGYSVTVFESDTMLGGMLRSCIPRFRLAEADIDKEINIIKNLGVEFKTETVFGKNISVDSLKKDGYKSIFLGIGAQAGVKMQIPGENLENCIPAVDFLKSVSSGNKPNVGKTVAVIGGGFTAIDSARTALRLGAENVYMLYRRTREEMPAADDEIFDAESEGIKIMYLVAPIEIEGKNKVEKIRMLNYVLAEKDPSGRRRPEAVESTEFTLDIDTVIPAISQSVSIEQDTDIALTEWNTIKTDTETAATNMQGVYAGGDCIGGMGNVISAIADGKRAAVSIDKQISGINATLDYDTEGTVVDKDSVLERIGSRKRKDRVVKQEATQSIDTSSFQELSTLLTPEQAIEEASRCLACGCGAGCEICTDICKVFAWETDNNGKVVLDQETCVACGMCIHRCPNNNIEMIQTGTENI